MKILYQDLLNFLAEKPTKDLLSEKLFQLGHEHEIDGEIFDMELTPNRGDCLSLIGLARDLNIFFGSSNALAYYDKDIDNLNIEFKNNAPSDCPKISFLEIEIEASTTNYKPYLENYFASVGGNKTNLFTDVSNYISYELGQPTHCFDSEKINGELVFENKVCNSNFETLLGFDISLKDKNCVFTAADEIISLAGVMGGASTACSLNTKKVLVECAYFNPESIIGKAIQYNLNSDAAYKFERGVDSESHDLVLRRFITIISEHANIRSLKIKSFNYENIQKKYIPLDNKKINEIIGIDIEESKYLNILNKLHFVIEDNKILVPTHRHDINCQNDLAEEVARIIGYNNVTSSPISLPKPEKNKLTNKVKHLESFFISNGFTETINYPFAQTEDKSVIRIDNPLDSSKGFFRTNLKASLVENFMYNQRRQKESIKLFEISDVYFKNPEMVYKKKLGVIVGGRQGYNFQNFSKKLSKEYLQTLLNGNLESDFFGIQEISAEELDTKKKDKVFYVEVFIEDIPDDFFNLRVDREKAINFIKYKPISEFPSSTRDLSFTIKNPLSFEKVLNMLENIEDELVYKSFIFDFYKNEKQETIKLGNRMIFQSQFKTLSDEDINKKLNELINPILAIDGVFIEGM